MPGGGAHRASLAIESTCVVIVYPLLVMASLSPGLVVAPPVGGHGPDAAELDLQAAPTVGRPDLRRPPVATCSSPAASSSPATNPAAVSVIGSGRTGDGTAYACSTTWTSPANPAVMNRSSMDW